MENETIKKEYNWGLTVRGIVKKYNKILILRRHPKSKNNPHKWELPGGKVDPGEFFDYAIIRELKEETNLNVRIISLFDAVEDQFESCKTHQYINTVQLMMNLELLSEDLKISSEHDDFKWVTIEELNEFYKKDILTNSLKRTLEKKNFKF